MNGIMAELLTIAKLITNYDKDATGGGLWVTTQSHKCTVPAGKRWWVLGGHIWRAVSSTMTVYFKDSSNNIIFIAADETATTGGFAWPEAGPSGAFPFPLDAGMYIDSAFGTAQDANSYATTLVLEIDI